MLKIEIFNDIDEENIITLVLHCQNDGSRPLVDVEDQPELRCIRDTYINPGGCFWVAKDHEQLAGCIGLMNYGNGIAILKKFFVYEAYRGVPCHLGKKLYDVLMAFAQEHHFREIILDTPKNTERAHKFYEKAGFRKVSEKDLPVKYDYPYKDCDFFLLKLF